MTWQQLTEKDCREWKLLAIVPHDRHIWYDIYHGAASQLPGRGPLMWMLHLYLHANKISDDPDDDHDHEQHHWHMVKILNHNVLHNIAFLTCLEELNQVLDELSVSSLDHQIFYYNAGTGATYTSPSRQLACCMHGRSHTRSRGMSIMRASTLCNPSVSCFYVILSFPGPRFPSTCMSKGLLTAPLERSTCPYQRSLFFRMMSRSSMPSRASSSLDLVVTMSCGLTLQICLIIAMSFCCKCWRSGFVNHQVSLAWSIVHCTRAVHTTTCPEREVAGKENW